MHKHGREHTQDGERDGVFARSRGIGEHLREIARLEGRLAMLEIGRGMAWLATGIAAFALAAVFAFFMLALLVGAAVAGVDAALPLWASLLIIAGGLGLLVGLAVGIGTAAFKRAVPVPRKAIKEIRKTTRAIRGGNGHG